jgi:hypothetical protein
VRRNDKQGTRNFIFDVQSVSAIAQQLSDYFLIVGHLLFLGAANLGQGGTAASPETGQFTELFCQVTGMELTFR